MCSVHTYLIRGGQGGKSLIKKLRAVVLSSILIAIGVNFFIVPHQLLNGGIIGIALITTYVWQIKLGFILICIGFPLYIATSIHSRNYVYNGVVHLIMASITIDLFHSLAFLPKMPILFSALTGGVFIGTGISIILLGTMSSRNTNGLAQISTPRFLFIMISMDLLLLLFGALVISGSSLFYSLLTVFMIRFTILTMNAKFNQ